VGRILAKRGLSRFGLFIGIATVSVFSPDSTTHFASASDAQTYPIISLNTPLARDAETFNDDKTLNAACRANGQGSEVCLCLTHVMKYELTLTEYKAATKLYGQPKDRSALYTSLKSEGFSASDISTAEQMERDLIADPDFALRCSEAKAYYRQSNG